MTHPCCMIFINLQLAIVSLIYKVQEEVGCLWIVPTKRRQAKLTMEKYDSIASLKKVFCRAGTSRSCREVVQESDCMLFQGNGCSTALATINIDQYCPLFTVISTILLAALTWNATKAFAADLSSLRPVGSLCCSKYSWLAVLLLILVLQR